jgi:hypothetical protein
VTSRLPLGTITDSAANGGTERPPLSHRGEAVAQTDPQTGASISRGTTLV